MDFSSQQHKKDLFYWLCFCICSTQTTYKSNDKVRKDLIQADFYDKYIPESKLQKILKPVRFYRNKARFLLDAKDKFRMILDLVKTNNVLINPIDKRKYLIDNIYGVGMKVASLFLREYGCPDMAVLDVHILRFLKSPLPRNEKEYLKLETTFSNIAKSQGINVRDLDIYLWEYYSRYSGDT